MKLAKSGERKVVRRTEVGKDAEIVQTLVIFRVQEMKQRFQEGSIAKDGE